MKYRTYGKLGIKMSAVGFGGMRFDLTRSEAENGDLLKYAFDQGINYFDTAPGYCSDRSESIFALGLKGLPRDQYYVTSKLQPAMGTDENDYYEKICKSVKTIGAGHIDFFHVWCIRTLQQYRDAFDKGLYAALERARKNGLIKHIVCSIHLPGELVRQVLEEKMFEGVLLGVNILNFPYRWDGVLAAQELGMGVVAMNPLAGGLIPQNEDKFKFLALHGETPTEAAIRFIAGTSAVTVGLVGFTTREQIDFACKNADLAEPLSNEEVAVLKKHLSQNMDSICTGCGYCLKGCPKKIDIRAFMQFYNRKVLFGKTEEEMKKDFDIESIYGLLGHCKEHPAGDCISCHNCERECTQHIPIVSNLKSIAAWENEPAAN